MILIGSASGIGSQLLHLNLQRELSIKHLIKTDFIREIVRGGIIGPDYAPALHKSSFDAYTTLRDKDRFRNNNIDSLICAGFENTLPS